MITFLGHYTDVCRFTLLQVRFNVVSSATLPVYEPHPEDVELDNEPTLFEQVITLAYIIHPWRIRMNPPIVVFLFVKLKDSNHSFIVLTLL